jgi:hypothetical protein
MRQIHRFGIEFDVCPTSGGIWLDKGELEKLIALIREETAAAEDAQRPAAVFQQDSDGDRNLRGSRRGSRDWRDDDDDGDEDRYHRSRRGRGERRGSRLLDLFDF